MGLVKGEDYISKPIDATIYEDYTGALDTNELQQTPIPAYLNPIPVNSEIFEFKSNLIGNGAQQLLFTLDEDVKLMITHINLIGFQAFANTGFATINATLPNSSYSNSNILGLYINAAGTIFDRNYTPGLPFVFPAGTSFYYLFPNNAAADLTIFGYLLSN